MDLADLTSDETLGLVALLKAAVMADGNVSEEEMEHLEEVVEALGRDVYEKTMDMVEERFPDEAALRTFLQTLKRQDARELIYGTVLDMAMVDTVVVNEESELMDWLRDVWKIEVEFDSPE